MFLRNINLNSEFTKAFPEIQSLSRLEHKNIVKYYTCWIEHLSSLNNMLPPNSLMSGDMTSGGVLSGNSATAHDPPQAAFFIQMEFCGGDTLASWLERRSARWTPGDVFALFHDILRGLIHVHSMGIVHRDLK